MTRTRFHTRALWAIGFLYALLAVDYYEVIVNFSIPVAVICVILALTLTPSLINLQAADCVEFQENGLVDGVYGAIFVLPLFQSTSVVLPGIVLPLLSRNLAQFQAVAAQSAFNIGVAALTSIGTVKVAQHWGRPMAVAFAVAMIVVFFLFEIFV